MIGAFPDRDRVALVRRFAHGIELDLRIGRQPSIRPLLHGDLLGQNILLAADGPHHVIDWEHVKHGDPAYDLAIVTRGVKQPFQIANGLDRLLEAGFVMGPTSLPATPDLRALLDRRLVSRRDVRSRCAPAVVRTHHWMQLTSSASNLLNSSWVIVPSLTAFWSFARFWSYCARVSLPWGHTVLASFSCCVTFAGI